MALTKQQKAGVVVASLAVGVLCVDRLLLGGSGPATASAQARAPAIGEPAGEGLLGAPSAPTLVRSGPSFAKELERFAALHQIRPDEDVPEVFGVKAEQADEVWTVSAVIGRGSRGAVRIGEDSELIPVGQQFNGAVLVRVDKNGAVFEKAGRQFRADLRRNRIENRVPEGVLERVQGRDGPVELQTPDS